jgi:subtilisin-like proprotein convertase family protein
MSYPSAPRQARFAIQSDGAGTVARGSGLADLVERSQWLAEHRGAVVTSWMRAWETTVPVVGAGQIGTFRLPPSGSASPTVQVWFYAVNDGGSVQYQASVGSVRVASVALSKTGWSSITLDLPTTTEPVDLRFWGNSVTGVGTQQVASLCVITDPRTTDADGEAAPLDPVPLAITHAETTGRPYDVHLLREIARRQNAVACRSRTLLSRYTLTKDVTDEDLVLHYVARVSPFVNTATIRLTGLQGVLSGSPSTPGSVTVEIGSASVTWSLGTGSGYLEDGAADVLIEKTIDVSGLARDETHEVVVTLRPASGNGSSVRVVLYDFQIVEDAIDPTYVVHASGDRLDTIPDRLRLPAANEPGEGEVIAATYREGDASVVSWRDRSSAYSGALHNLTHRTTMLVGDGFGDDDTESSTVGSSTAKLLNLPVTGVAGVGATSLRVAVNLSRTFDATVDGYVRIYKEPAGAVIAELTGIAVRRGWYEVTIPVEEGETFGIFVRGGFYDLNGAATTTTAVLTLHGLCVWEDGAIHQRNGRPYFYGNLVASTPTIPANDSVDVEFEVPDSHSLPVRRVRVLLNVDILDLSDLTITLTSPDATTRTIAAGPAASLAYYSDAAGGFIGDTAPSQSFAEFIGESAAGTWTLTVTNAGGDVGSVQGVELELW